MMSSNNSLPSFVASVFAPASAAAADNLRNAARYTRIHIIATPEVARDALNSTPRLKNTFLLGHLSDVLVFDKNEEEHTAHVSAVLEMLRGKGLKADINHCSFDKKNWMEAGFHIEPIGGDGRHAFMVVLREHLAPDALRSIGRSL